MTYYIEIKDDKQQQKLSSLDLPLAIIIYQNKENKDNFLISIEKPDNYFADKEKLKEPSGEVLAYLAEDEGHLFLQPETENTDIFHNDELIKKSVWIKSGDQLNIEHKIIGFKISGDKIHIRVFKEPELIPPPTDKVLESIHLKKPETSYIEKTPNSALSELDNQNNNTDSSVSPLRKNILIVSLIALILITLFVLFAKTVSLNVSPEPDSITINGLFPAVKIGSNYIMLSGSYELELHKTGYQSIHKTILVNAEQAGFNYQMKEKPGLVKFNIIPPENNKIYIDNVLLDNNNAQSMWYEIEAGQHDLKIVNKRYQILKENIKVKGKEKKQDYTFKLEPNWGFISLNTKPEQAEIVLTPLSYNNETIKKLTAPVKQELLAGQYQLDVSKEKYLPLRKILTIVAKKNLHLGIIKLDPKPAKIEFVSQPDNALLQVDGQYIGKTPLTTSLKAFKEHSYSLSLAAYKTEKGIIKPEADEHKTVNIKLKAEKGTVFISTAPKNAKLYIDGKRQSQASGSFGLTGKQHTISVKAKGYSSQTKTINARNYSTNISFILQKNSSGAVKKNASSSVNKNNNKTINNTSNKSNKKGNKHNKISSYINTIGQKMILMRPAKFVMGSAKNEIGRRSNERLHTVKLTYPYYISAKEISNQQYKLFKSAHNSAMSLGQSLDRAIQPVVNISWDEAAQFANWLSKKEGLTPFYEQVNTKMVAKKNKQINGYRLPYEAEWSHAARGKSNQKYPWPGNFPPPDMSGNFADESVSNDLAQYIEGYNDQHKVSAPVGSYRKNSFGFYDMGGNVSEWCQDFYSPTTSFSSKTIIDPTGPVKGIHHIVRDSSWRDASITELRLSYRNYSKKQANDLGFRLARYAQ